MATAFQKLTVGWKHPDDQFTVTQLHNTTQLQFKYDMAQDSGEGEGVDGNWNCQKVMLVCTTCRQMTDQIYTFVRDWVSLT